jgi:hypothetical protein
MWVWMLWIISICLLHPTLMYVSVDAVDNFYLSPPSHSNVCECMDAVDNFYFSPNSPPPPHVKNVSIGGRKSSEKLSLRGAWERPISQAKRQVERERQRKEIRYSIEIKGKRYKERHRLNRTEFKAKFLFRGAWERPISQAKRQAERERQREEKEIELKVKRYKERDRDSNGI